jgi:hypothetical protein
MRTVAFVVLLVCIFIEPLGSARGHKPQSVPLPTAKEPTIKPAPKPPPNRPKPPKPTQTHLVRLQPDDDLVPHRVRVAGEDEVRGRAELETDLRLALGEGLARAQDERHARPAVVVDVERDRGKGGRLAG